MTNSKNELQFDDEWSWGMYEKLFGSYLAQWSRHGRSLVAFRGNSKFVQFVQRKAHVDLAMELLDGVLGIDWKCVRHPRKKTGEPHYSHWQDFLFELMSCTIPGQEAQGWGINSTAELILWAQASLDEKSANCWPIPLKPWRAWIHKHREQLEVTDIENIIDGRALWTQCLKTPIQRLCRDLKIEGFRVDEGGLVTEYDLLGKTELRFHPDGRVDVLHRRA